MAQISFTGNNVPYLFATAPEVVDNTHFGAIYDYNVGNLPNGIHAEWYYVQYAQSQNYIGFAAKNNGTTTITISFRSHHRERTSATEVTSYIAAEMRQKFENEPGAFTSIQLAPGQCTDLGKYLTSGTSQSFSIARYAIYVSGVTSGTPLQLRLFRQKTAEYTSAQAVFALNKITGAIPSVNFCGVLPHMRISTKNPATPFIINHGSDKSYNSGEYPTASQPLTARNYLIGNYGMIYDLTIDSPGGKTLKIAPPTSVSDNCLLVKQGSASWVIKKQTDLVSGAWNFPLGNSGPVNFQFITPGGASTQKECTIV